MLLLLHCREFVRVFGPEGPDAAEPLRHLLSQHASTLVNGLLTACTASQDVGLGSAVQDAAAAMCSCAPEYLPELLAERCAVQSDAQQTYCRVLRGFIQEVWLVSHQAPKWSPQRHLFVI